MTKHKVCANNFEFDVICKGDAKNDAILFLHGFPEFARMWFPFIEYFSKSGFYCIAPNQRGYSEGAAPSFYKEYRLDYLVEDVDALANHFKINSFHLVGHDWGAAVGWQFVTAFPKKIKSFTALSVPNNKAVLSDLNQLRKVWYMFLFQLPLLPEWILSRNNFKGLREILTHHTKEEIETYILNFANKSILKGAINWYRANLRLNNNSKFEVKKYTGPTLMIYGNEDIAVTKRAIKEGEKHVFGPYEYIEYNASHWLVQEKELEIIDALTNFIRKYNSVPRGTSYS